MNIFLMINFIWLNPALTNFMKYMSNNTYKLFILKYCSDTLINPETNWKQVALFRPVFPSQVGYVITNNRFFFWKINF